MKYLCIKHRKAVNYELHPGAVYEIVIGAPILNPDFLTLKLEGREASIHTVFIKRCLKELPDAKPN